MKIGVLALQGDFAMHARALQKCGAEVVGIRTGAEAGRKFGLAGDGVGKFPA